MSKMCLVYSSTIVEVKAWPKYICFVLLIAPSKEDMLYVGYKHFLRGLLQSKKVTSFITQYPAVRTAQSAAYFYITFIDFCFT